MHKITAPADWFTAIVYKPLWVFQALTHMVPFIINCRKSVCTPRVIGFFKDLRSSPAPYDTKGKPLKIGAAGFCWGGYYTFQLAQDRPSSRVAAAAGSSSGGALVPLIDAGFTAHPSMLTIPTDAEPVTVPLSVSVGHNDFALKEANILKMKEILEGKNKKGDDVQHEVVILKDAKHGFSVRTEKEPYQIECAEKAEAQAISWFGRWFGQ